MVSHPPLYTLLGIAVFHRTGPGDFHALENPPSWWNRLVDSWGEPFKIPFIEDYLVVAERFWSTGSDGLSQPEVFQAEADDATTTLEITAANTDGSHYLMIRSLDTGSVGITDVLQTARDSHLRHTREIDEHVELQIDLSRAKEAAELLSQAKTQFLANVSHEIRTPLTAILGTADLLADTPLDDDQRKFVEAMQSSSDHLLRVVNDLLDFSRVESGHFELESIPIDLRSFAEQLACRFAARAKTKGLRYSVAVGDDAPSSILSDPVRLAQITDNLVGNSLKFTDDGHVRVDFELNPKNRDELLLIVADTGVGISDDKQELIFHSFVQEDASTTRRFGGTGLGLAIVRQLTSVMGGSVALESRPGEGTTFFVTLPLTLDLTPSQPVDHQTDRDDVAENSDHEPDASAASDEPSDESQSTAHKKGTSTGVVPNDLQTASGLQTAALFDSIQWDDQEPDSDSKSNPNASDDHRADEAGKTVEYGWSDGDAGGQQDDWLAETLEASATSGNDWYADTTSADPTSAPVDPHIAKSDEGGSERAQAETVASDAGEWTAVANASKVADTADTDSQSTAWSEESSGLADKMADATQEAPLRREYDDEPIESFLPPTSKRAAKSKDTGSESHRNVPTTKSFRKPNDPSHLRVLLAEDNAAIRMLLTRMLEKSGHTVITANNGQEAVDHATEEIDLILMDCQMPVLDGYRATQEIRKRESGKASRLPIVALTAHAMAGFREKCVAHGMDDYLTKPLNQTELESMIVKTLGIEPQPG